jgi:ubiquinone biosynthesis accessory factor UbiK
MEQFRIDEIARRLLESVPPAFRSMQQDLEANFRSVLRTSLGKLDVVTRDEFDTQLKVLERTRSKLEALEKKVAEMEASAAAGAAARSGTTATGADSSPSSGA